LTLTPLVLKGTVGERFHVLYLASELLAVGLVLERVWQAEDRRWGLLLAASGIYVGAMLSWADWTAGVLRPGWPFALAAAPGAICGAVYCFAEARSARRFAVLAVLGLAMGLCFLRGPLQWGRFAPFAPEPGSPVLPQVEAMYHGGS
jgi:hypothetical protein